MMAQGVGIQCQNQAHRYWAVVEAQATGEGLGTYEVASCCAAHAGHTQITEALVEAGVDAGPSQVAARTAAREACSCFRSRWLARQKDAYVAALCNAAQVGDLRLMRALIKEGGVDVSAEPNQLPPYPALTRAAHSGEVEVVRMLATVWGADVNQRVAGTTPLIAAAISGDAEVVRVLVTEGKADVDAADDGLTPLISAASKGHVEIVRVLLMEGKAKVAPPNNNRLALRLAASKGLREACFSLCALGAIGADTTPPEEDQRQDIEDQALSGWLDVARGYGNALKIALERRDYAAAIYLLQSRQTDRPTPTLIQQELLPIASTVGVHKLARPVCSTTRRVAELASELYSNRWSPKVHALCGEEQRAAVMAVMIIMLRAGHACSARSRRGGVQTRRTKLAGRPEQLPIWMHQVPDDAWWKVLEMMGLW